MNKRRKPRLKDIRQLFAHKLTQEAVRAMEQIDVFEDENEHAVAGIWYAYACFLRETYRTIDPMKEHAYENDDPCLPDVVETVKGQCLRLQGMAECIKEQYDLHEPEDETGSGMFMGEPVIGNKGLFNQLTILKWFNQDDSEGWKPILWDHKSPEEQEEFEENKTI